MTRYNYREGKKRIEEILDKQIKINEEKIPINEEFDCDTVYHGWVGAIFINIKDSAVLFANNNKEMIFKVIKSFISELIEILREENSYREIGIRNENIYAIYPTPSKDDVYELYQKTVYINTYIKMINELFIARGYEQINIGIGAAISKEFVMKVERKGVKLNNKIWIGDSIIQAEGLATLGMEDGNEIICISEDMHYNIVEKGVENNGKEFNKWFEFKTHTKYGDYYTGDLIKTNFSEWIDEGMKENDENK